MPVLPIIMICGNTCKNILSKVPSDIFFYFFFICVGSRLFYYSWSAALNVQDVVLCGFLVFHLFYPILCYRLTP